MNQKFNSKTTKAELQKMLRRSWARRADAENENARLKNELHEKSIKLMMAEKALELREMEADADAKDHRLEIEALAARTARRRIEAETWEKAHRAAVVALSDRSPVVIRDDNRVGALKR
jgi:hypothetical protein